MSKKYNNEDFILSDADERISEEITRDQQKELMRYKESYKNILWIDDRDDGGANIGSLKWMKDWLRDKNTCMHIEQIKLFRNAMDSIIHNSSQYDLVIFDINLKKGFAPESGEKTYIEETLKKYHIKFTYPVTDDDHMIDGYYLFRLLLAVGYPLERMRIFSGHTNIQNAQNLLPDIIIDDQIYLQKGKDKLNIESIFFAKGKQDYYRVRRLVYQACAYWAEQIKSINKFPFDELYSLEIGKKSFLGMLEHIKMLFPVKQPANPKSVYYRAMQFVAAFHEESADIFNKNILISNYPKLRKYHLCIRNFRNWSAHNKMKSELDGDMFALLLCIALRTYFKWKSDIDLISDLLPYEDVFGFDKSISINQNELRKKLYKEWKEIHEELNNGDVKEKYRGFYRDLSKAIHNFGYVNGIKNMERYLFLPIWSVNSFNTKLDVSDNETYVTFTVNSDDIKALINAANSKGTEGCFMRFCSQWLSFD